MSNSLSEYKSRQKEWRDITVNQLSITNNLLTTFVLGYLVLVFERKAFQNAIFVYNSKFDWNLTLYFVTIILIIIAFFYGVAVNFTRLYDFRISRQLAFIRLRLYKIHQVTLKGYDEDLNDTNSIERIKSFLQIIFFKINFITLKEIKDYKANPENFKKKFESLQKLARILGSSSWRWTKLQIGFIIISMITYLIYLFNS